MKIRVLGSCAGGGLPQRNCGDSNPVRTRARDVMRVRIATFEKRSP
jgi:hypothetical protein